MICARGQLETPVWVRPHNHNLNTPREAVMQQTAPASGGDHVVPTLTSGLAFSLIASIGSPLVFDTRDARGRTAADRTNSRHSGHHDVEQTTPPLHTTVGKLAVTG